MYAQFMIRNHKFLFPSASSSSADASALMAAPSVNGERKTFSIVVQLRNFAFNVFSLPAPSAASSLHSLMENSARAFKCQEAAGVDASFPPRLIDLVEDELRRK